jgi:hypothetical protein
MTYQNREQKAWDFNQTGYSLLGQTIAGNPRLITLRYYPLINVGA